jgi:hypothetical protein
VRPPVSRWDLDDEDELDDDDGDFSSFRQDASNGDASEDLTKADGTRRDRPEE